MTEEKPGWFSKFDDAEHLRQVKKQGKQLDLLLSLLIKKEVIDHSEANQIRFPR